eukprot:9164167-Alexandrium_andersonii.AAC.1
MPVDCLPTSRGGTRSGLHPGTAVATATLRVGRRHAGVEVEELRGPAPVADLADLPATLARPL